MAKLSVEYSRTVRVKQYETMKIGLVMEFDTSDFDSNQAFTMVRSIVEDWILNTLAGLKTEPMKAVK